MKHPFTWKERLLASAVALLVWQLCAAALGQTILLPSPAQTVRALLALLPQKTFLSTIWHTAGHILGGFALALLLGSVLAVVSARFRWIEGLLWPYLAVIRATPVASFIILCLVWVRVSDLSLFICFLMVLPVIYTNILTGIRSADEKLLEMAAVFRLDSRRRVLAIWLPALRPYLTAAFESAIGMAWKAGVAAEVIGVPARTIGRMLYDAKIYLATPELFAWTVVIVTLSAAFEKLAVWALGKVYAHLEGLLWL
jgi:NitT/TauT family transport system permease protein